MTSPGLLGRGEIAHEHRMAYHTKRERSSRRDERRKRDARDAADTVAEPSSTGHHLQETLGNQGLLALHRQSLSPHHESSETASQTKPVSGDWTEHRGPQPPRPTPSQTTAARTRSAEERLPSGSGRPLATSLRADYESALDTDLGDVRIHTGQETDKLARSINATAFTVGTDIGFASGGYTPNTTKGARLLAHELTHVVQGRDEFTAEIGQPAILEANTAAEREAEAVAHALTGPMRATSVPVAESYEAGFARSRGPDVIHAGHYSFIVEELVLGDESDVHIQLFQDPDHPESATFAIWFEGTGERERVPFRPDGPIAPELLEVAPGVVTIDLTGDIVPDLILYADANPATRGVDFTAYRGDDELLSLSAVPSRTTPEAVPESAEYMGELPTGKSYYRLFGTAGNPRGPLYVNEDGRVIDPGLEAAAETAMRGFEWFAGGIGLLGLLPVAAPAGAKAAGVVGTLARGAAAAPLSVKAGGAGVTFAASVTNEAIEHGAALDEYDWGSIGLNTALGWISGGAAHAAVSRWPAPIFSRPLRLETWRNLGRQQIMFGLYGTSVGLVKSLVADSDADRAVIAEHAENLLSQSVNEGRDQFLRSEQGRRHFPRGKRDPRIQAIDTVLSFIVKVSVNRAMAETEAEG